MEREKARERVIKTDGQTERRDRKKQKVETRDTRKTEGPQATLQDSLAPPYALKRLCS